MQVELVAIPCLAGGMHNVAEEVGWKMPRDCTSAERLIEFAGRNCYQSWDNPANKTNAEYIKTLLEHGHGSVLEHASATFFVTGISRSLTHELIRHRHLSYSEMSQRYVDSRYANLVIPPALVGKLPIWWEQCVKNNSQDNYRLLVQQLETAGLPRKQAREAARCVLLNCTETKIVVTGNFRAWRGVIDQRGGDHADAEIRRLVVEVCRLLRERFPACFGDYVETTLPNGEVGVRSEWRKV